MRNDTTEELNFSDGEIIIVEGARTPAVYFVADGVVKVSTRDENDHEVVLARLQRGEIFGEMSLMGDAPASATVAADGDAVVQKMTRDAFMEAINSPLARMVMESLFARLRRMNSRFLEADGRLDQGVQAQLSPAGQQGFVLTGVTAIMRESMDNNPTVIDKFPFHFGRDGKDSGGISALFSLWSNDLSVDDHAPYTVSRKHCLIDKRRGGYYLVDQHSHYGTLVDDALVGGDSDQNELRLEPGQHRLQLGTTASSFVMLLNVPQD